MSQNYKQKKWGAMMPSILANTKRLLCDGTTQSYTYIPIDYVKWEVIGVDSNMFLNNPNLSFTPVLKYGDQLHKYFTIVEGMKMQISVQSQRTTLSGSIHKFWNGGLHNHNDFDCNAFNLAMDNICHLFKVNASCLRILAMEYGVNIIINDPVKFILNNCFQHKGKDIEVKISNDGGKYHQAEHNRYILKLYDKGKQYKLPGINLMRIEIKEQNWTMYRKNGIIMMEDFIKCDKSIFIENLVDQWMNVILYDFNAPEGLIKQEYTNVNYWRELRDKIKSKEISKTTFHRHWHSLKEHNRNHGINIQFQIAEQIMEKINELQNVTNSIFSDEINLIKERICPITGIEISEQRPDSFLLSHRTLHKLKLDHPDQFIEIKNRFLTGKWLNYPDQDQVKEIAHNIRNKFFNTIYRIKRQDQSGQLRFEFQL
jgi:hypothetical protein